MGGLATLKPSMPEGRGARLRTLLREVTGQERSAPPEVYAEAERLAESIARIAAPRIHVHWAAPETKGRAPGEVHLDPRLLEERRGWDLPHRIDALMGMTLRDAAHTVRTPPTFRADLLQYAKQHQLFADNEADGVPAISEDSDDRLAPLLALFLLIEMAHISAWLDAELPGFHGYGETLWLWMMPTAMVEQHIRALSGRPTFGAIVTGAAVLMANRTFYDRIPPDIRPLLESVCTAVGAIGAEAPPEARYSLAMALYRMLKDLFESSEHRARTEGAASGPAGDREQDIAPPEERPELANETLESRQAALEALAAIAGSRLDPQEAREELAPEQWRDLQRMRGGQERRGGGTHGAADDDEETPSFVAHRHLRVEGRPMRVITPPIAPDVRVRYRGSYTMMRGQAAALRQVLMFRLAERRHATRGQFSGQLDEQALYRLAGGDDGVFMRRTVESAPDQDICILLDESASMGRNERYARATAVLFHHALEGLPGVHHWIFGFSGYGSAIALYRYISPSRVDLQRPERLGAIRSREATPLGEAVAGAAEAMLSEGHARERLMIVVTDGQPDDLDGTRKALRAAESRGVAILGLGIAADATAARDLFSHFTLYSDVATLPRKVGAVLQRIMHTAP